MPPSGTIYGRYEYSYGPFSYAGMVDVSQVSDKQISFEINSNGKGEAPSLAIVEPDTISFSGGRFIYKIPDSDSCEFETIFYNGFLVIRLTKGYCEGQFGLNSYIDGIFLKIE